MRYACHHNIEYVFLGYLVQRQIIR